MNTTTDHPLLDFASRYADPTQDYLNAYMAIARLDMLLEDLTKVRDLLEAEHPKEQRWYPWFGAEIISYYAVGFVTCLEWHAKSRLIDLLTFQPSSLKIEDVKGTISEKLIVQMVARQASVIQLVGASVKVASTEKYFSIIDRVFKGLGLPFSSTEWLFGKASGATVCWIRPGQLASLDRLLTFGIAWFMRLALPQWDIQIYAMPGDQSKLRKSAVWSPPSFMALKPPSPNMRRICFQMSLLVSAGPSQLWRTSRRN